MFNFLKTKKSQETDLAQDPFVFGDYTFSIPIGFNELKRSKDLLVLKSIKDEQQITVSGMMVNINLSYEDFKNLCDKRIEAEKIDLHGGFVSPGEPFKSDNTFAMFFSGGNKNTKRIFSGYLSVTKGELITVYVEGSQISPEQHLNFFKKVVNCVKRNK